MFYATRQQVYWDPTHEVVSCKYSDLISYTNKDAQHIQGLIDWHTHINRY